MNKMIGKYDTYNGKLYQRGYGLGGQFRRFFKWVVPLFKKHALPKLKDAAKTLGKEALSSVSDISKDLISGVDVKTASTQRINEAIDNLASKAENKLEGNGIKRKVSFKKYTIVKKQKKKSNKESFDDIFA